MKYPQAIAAVQTGTDYAYRNVWPSPAAIANDSGTINYWLETNQGGYTPTQQDKDATDWILQPDNGDRPPRGT